MIKRRPNESFESLLKRHKRELNNSGVLTELRRREYAKTKSQKRREKEKEAAQKRRRYERQQAKKSAFRPQYHEDFKPYKNFAQQQNTQVYSTENPPATEA